MRKIIVTEMITIDGVMQAPGGVKEDTSGGFEYGGWTAHYADDEGGKFVQSELSQNVEYLLGRKTFDVWANFWPAHTDIWPGINDHTKYVMTKTVKQTNWQNTVFIDSLEDIKKLKNSPGPDIQVWGSSQVVHLLLKHDLVDELCLKIYPVILGAGKKLFCDGAVPAAFRLTNSLTTKTGVVIATYQRAGQVIFADVEELS